ncbi:MAG TPA: c-type cytochrome [Nitrospira sp.]|nr:c-type cytochrome [Nitrospira sp.]
MILLRRPPQHTAEKIEWHCPRHTRMMADYADVAPLTEGTNMTRIFVTTLVVVLTLAGAVLNQSDASSDATRKTDPLAKGKRLFARHCAGCHGPEGKGDGYKLLGPDPANLTAPATRKQSDRALLATIHEGKPNMPSWKGLLSERDIKSVLAYVRSLPH